MYSKEVARRMLRAINIFGKQLNWKPDSARHPLAPCDYASSYIALAAHPRTIRQIQQDSSLSLVHSIDYMTSNSSDHKA
jgi:hypothetical protein